MSDIITVSQRYYVSEVIKRSGAHLFKNVKKGHIIRLEIPIVKPEKTGTISYCVFFNETTGETDAKPLGRSYQTLKAFRLRKVAEDYRVGEEAEVTRRISKTQYYLDIALAVSKRSTCLRRKYGAVIVKGDSIISTGYNGSPRGDNNCIDTGTCYRETKGIPHGAQYEKCKAVHAEMNAISVCSRLDLIGANLYLAGEDDAGELEDVKPCDICYKMIKNAGIKRVITRSGLIPIKIDTL